MAVRLMGPVAPESNAGTRRFIVDEGLGAAGEPFLLLAANSWTVSLVLEHE